jgi:hypothetical protein
MSGIRVSRRIARLRRRRVTSKKVMARAMMNEMARRTMKTVTDFERPPPIPIAELMLLPVVPG